MRWDAEGLAPVRIPLDAVPNKKAPLSNFRKWCFGVVRVMLSGYAYNIYADLLSVGIANLARLQGSYWNNISNIPI